MGAPAIARMPAPYHAVPHDCGGTRLPAFHTSLGRIQLGFLDEAEVWNRLRAIRLTPYTPSTIVDPGALIEQIKDDHAHGFSIVDEELERALRSIAVAIVTRSGRCVGAINVSSNAARMTRNELRRHVPGSSSPFAIGLRRCWCSGPAEISTSPIFLLTVHRPLPMIRPHDVHSVRISNVRSANGYRCHRRTD